MDSRTVNAEIKRSIWPALRAVGFVTFSERTAWRHHQDRIDVFSFQSYNSYNAGVLGCTTYSFKVSLGCFSKIIPPDYEPHRIKIKAGKLLPSESECHFRGQLSRTFKQAEFKERGLWYMDPKGRYLEPAMKDVASLIERKALPWFDNFSVNEYAIQTLLSSDEDMKELWGFGRKDSPVRHYFIGYLALGAGRMDLAERHLSLAVASGCFADVEKRLVSDIESANKRLQETRETRA
jgi:Domain of unknown function (DUF4304)